MTKPVHDKSSCPAVQGTANHAATWSPATIAGTVKDIDAIMAAQGNPAIGDKVSGVVNSIDHFGIWVNIGTRDQNGKLENALLSTCYV